MVTVACPKCGFEEPERARECSRCGIVFKKFLGGAPPSPADVRPRPSTDDDDVTDGRIGPTELKIIVIGLVAAVVVYSMPLTRFLFAAIKTLFHEIGHAVVAWLLGHPAIPAFDFTYGGGFTHMEEFKLPIALAIAAGFAYVMWLVRQNRVTLALVGGLFLVWLFIVTSEWRREIAFASAGVLAEYIWAAVFFYLALAGIGWRVPEIERPLGAFVAFLVQIYSLRFAWTLIHDADAVQAYRQGKDGGGALMNDLEVVALDLHIHTPLNPGIVGLARLLLVFSFVPITVALLWYFKRPRWHRMLRSLLTT